MKQIYVIVMLLLVITASAAEHNPILPQPQKLSYGKAFLSLKGATIGFASQPAAEDMFAAEELQGILSKATGSAIEIKEIVKQGSTITFERTGNIDPLPVPDEKTGPGSRESYAIKITAKQVHLSAKSSAGLFYAVQTLRQLIEGDGDKAVLPEAEIEDWPSLAYRGFMMDMSHAQLPKIQEIKNQIDFLALWKSNQYYFYSEASIELDGYPLLMADARYTKQQVKEIIEYAKLRHIDVIPNMELYGHLHDLFRLEHYADLSVVPHGAEFKPNDPRVKPILEDWVKQISDLFPSPFFHIGFDETWLIELEAKKVAAAPEDLYLKMLSQTTDLVEKQGKHPLVWADMLQKFPSIIPKVSKKTIAVPWHYFPMTEKEYENALSPFYKAGVDMIVQSALINWDWLYPAFEISFQNTDMLIAAGRKYKAVGFINSGWTDDTQTLMRLSFPDLAYGSAASWQSRAVDRDNFFKNYARAQYPEALAEKAGQALKSLTVAETILNKVLGSTDQALWADPFTKEIMNLSDTNRANLHAARLALEDAQVLIREAMKYKTDSTTFFSMFVGAKMLDFLALKYMYAIEINDLWKQAAANPDREKALGNLYVEITHKYHTRTSDLMEGILELKELFGKAWLDEYTPFRLGVALGKYDSEFQYWYTVQKRFVNIERYIDPKGELPALNDFLKK